MAHLSADSILVDDFTLGHEKEERSTAWQFTKGKSRAYDSLFVKLCEAVQEPSINQKFIDQLTSVGHLGIRTWKAEGLEI